MSAERALRIVAYLVVAMGATALWVAELLDVWGLAVVALALAGGGWLRGRAGLGPALDRVFALAVAGFAVLDVAYLAERIFDGLVRLLVLLVVLRLLTARRPRQFRDAGLLAFFMLVASAAVAFGVGFLFVFVAFFVASTVLLVLAHELGEVERAGGRAAVTTLTVGRGLVTLGLGAAAASLVVTFVLFFVIPRIGEATLALRTPTRRMLVGFSDRVELGAIGELEQDTSVAMRVRLLDAPLTPELVGALRWRGVALDHFDGRMWTATRRRRVPFGRGRSGVTEIDGRGGTNRLVTQEIFLEPIGTETLFAAPRVVRVNLGGGFVAVDDMGALSVPTPAARLTYTVESIVAGKVPERLAAGAAARYLQLPPLAPRIPSLAREVTAGTDGPAAAGVALVTFLHRQFTYSLSLERHTALPPLEEFLFVSRRGNCEYFASALAVMLRSLGIPARVITGFQRGEWNPYGEYFLVRMADAHAWVEAYVDGAGWITLDPSPREPGADAGWRGPTLYFDALRLTWHRYIVSWSSQDQFRAAATVRRAAVAWRPGRGAHWSPWPEVGWALPGVGFAAGALAWLVWRWVVAGTPRRQAPVPEFYRRALRTLARRGLRLEPGETAREFAARVSRALPARAGVFTRVTAAYEAVRFGGALLDRDERAGIDGCLRELATRREPSQTGVAG